MSELYFMIINAATDALIVDLARGHAARSVSFFRKASDSL
jgi:hypothetical protein